MPRQRYRMELNSRAWNAAVVSLAYSYFQIRACADCGGPVVEGYVCETCGSTDPSTRSAKALPARPAKKGKAQK